MLKLQISVVVFIKSPLFSSPQKTTYGGKTPTPMAPIAEEWPVSHGSRVMINYIEQGTIKSKIKLVYEKYRCDMTCTHLILLSLKNS